MSMGFYDIARKVRLVSGAANEPVSGLVSGPVSALTQFTHLMRGLFLQLILLATLLQLALFSTLAPHSRLSQFSPSTLFSPLSPQDTLTSSGTPSSTPSGMPSSFGHSGSAYSGDTPITPLRGGDFTPGVGDIKGGFECSASVSWSTCLGAVIGIIPILGDGAKILIKRGRETLEAWLGKTGKLDVDIPDELATDWAIGFSSDTVDTAFDGMRGDGGHAIRHLQNDGLIPNTGSLASRVDTFKSVTRDILMNPSKTFDHPLGPPNNKTLTRGFTGTVNGERVVVFVAKEGPYQGRVISAFKPSPQQVSNWGLQ